MRACGGGCSLEALFIIYPHYGNTGGNINEAKYI
jgi:hypothetical protein